MDVPVHKVWETLPPVGKREKETQGFPEKSEGRDCPNEPAGGHLMSLDVETAVPGD